MSQAPPPPRLFGWALALLLDDRDRRVALAELAELYARRRARHGAAAAGAWYRRQSRHYTLRLAAERLRGGSLRLRAAPRREPARRPPDRGETMHAWIEELRLSARSLLKHPGLTLTIVLTVGLGIGATATMLSTVDAVLLAPLPYQQPERLVRIYRDHGPGRRWPVSVAGYQALGAQQTRFERIAAFRNTTMTFHREDVVERVAAALVTPGYFPLLGIAPRHGRTFGADDAVPGSARTALLSHRFWQQRLGADRGAIGEAISLDGEPYTVVGVLPPGVGPLEARREVFAILQLEPPARRGPFFLRVLGRLAPGVTLAAAQHELRAINDRIFPIWQSSYPDATVTFATESVHEFVVGDVGTPLLILLGAVAFVLLIASTNAANLLVARGARRARELAVRAALGASRLRLLRLLLTESAVLALGSAALGLALTAVSLRLLRTAGAALLPRAAELGLSGPALWLVLAVMTGSVLLFGLIPALQVIGSDFVLFFRTGGRTATGGGRAQRVRRALVVTQLAVAVPLLVGAGLLLGSFLRLQRVDPGFPAQRLLSVNLPVAAARAGDGGAARAFWAAVSERVAALPGVAAVGAATGRPPAEYAHENNFNLLDQPTPADRPEPTCPWLSVDAGYFQALGIPLLRGRLSDQRPREDPPLEVVVDETWARRFYAGGDAVGKRFTSGGCNRPDCPVLTVVGVVGDVAYTGLDDPGRGVVYMPQSLDPFRWGYLFVRTEVDPYALLPSIRAAVRELDPTLPLTRIATMDELLRDDLAAPRRFLALVGGFAAAALLLAVIGIYGVMAYFVEQHRREIGIRIAIGGAPGTIWRLIVARGLRLAALGLAAGIAGALVLTRFIAGMLFEVSPTDATTFTAVALLLAATALIACLLPARRAARVDPASTLRPE